MLHNHNKTYKFVALIRNHDSSLSQTTLYALNMSNRVTPHGRSPNLAYCLVWKQAIWDEACSQNAQKATQSDATSFLKQREKLNLNQHCIQYYVTCDMWIRST